MVQSCNTMDTWHHRWFYIVAQYTRSGVAEHKVEDDDKDLNWYNIWLKYLGKNKNVKITFNAHDTFLDQHSSGTLKAKYFW